MIFDKVNLSNGYNLQNRRPDSVNVISPSAKLMPPINDNLIQTLPLSDLQKSGLVETMLRIKKHEDVDVKQWGKGLIKLWKAKFQ